MKRIFYLACLLFGAFNVKAQTTIKANEAASHLNETVTICDSVYSSRDLGNLIVFNFGGAFPKQPLTLVIFKNDVAKFTDPLKAYTSKRLCITGKVADFKGKTQIVLNDPKQLQ